MGIIASSPNWHAPAHVRAWQTYRHGGVSAAPYDSLNLALHVGDDPAHVQQNRQIVQKALQMSQTPVFLEQTHTNCVVKISDFEKTGGTPCADASWTDQPGTVLAVMTADCLPVLLTDTQGTVVAAVHAGWRGLENGVIDAAVAALPEAAENLLAWIGPGISQAYFEVGDEVRDMLLVGGRAAQVHFMPNDAGRWQMDLTGIARWQLTRLGVERVWQADVCTYGDAAHFFSYRRDGQTGRMATFIWIEEQQ